MHPCCAHRTGRWVGRLRSVALWLALPVWAAGCGGGGGSGGNERAPTVVSVRFVGTDGATIDAVNPGFVPRNAWVELTFEAPIDPLTAREPYIRVRRGPYFQEPSLGQFHVDGARVLLDPTVLAGGQAQPYGFGASLEHEIRIPAGVPTGEMVRNRSGQPILNTFIMKFTTTNGWIQESTPPTLLGYTFLPGQRPDGTVNAMSSVQLEFSEPISPAALKVAVGATGPSGADAFDARFSTTSAVNQTAGIAGSPIVMRATLVGSGRSVRLDPVFGYGDRPFVFKLDVLSGLKDLAGNGLSPSITIGPFLSAGDGAPPPTVLGEGFDSLTDADPAPLRDSATAVATWSLGSLTAQPVSTRRCYIQSAKRALLDNVNGVPGIYVIYPAPLTGRALAAAIPGFYPPPAAGRRVVLSFVPDEIGPSGTILAAGWGPDRNATFASTHPELIVRFGYGVNSSVSLGSKVSLCYESTPIIAYRGPYTVAQRANVGNLTPVIANTSGVAGDQPLYDYTGFVEWPTFTQSFEWDSTRSRPLLLDVSATEGDTWQDSRGYYAGPVVGPGGLGVNWAPPRRFATTFEGDYPIAPSTAAAPNPDASVMDTVFTIGRNRSIAQSRFYTPGTTDLAGNAYPAPYSTAHTFGTRSDYSAALVIGSIPSGVSVSMEYQGAMALDGPSGRSAPDLSQASTPWTSNVNDCDGYPYVRWRASLVGDFATSAVAVLDSIVLQVAKKP